MNKNLITKALCVGLIAGISGVLHAAPSEGSCWVLGVREPGSNIYNGPTTCDDTILTYITVRGPLKLNNTKINGKTFVHGPIKANSANLQDVDLENNLSAETITLESSTLVNGDITFKGKAGVVYVDGSSKIKGKVINGKVVYQNDEQ